MNIDRMKLLLKVLEREQVKIEDGSAGYGFDISSWGESTEEGDTYYCAWGLFAISPEGEELGLTVEWDEGVIFYEYKGSDGFDSIAELLGIAISMAINMFGVSSYDDPTLPNVISRIQRLIEREGEKVNA
jgi:hypothetical protein